MAQIKLKDVVIWDRHIQVERQPQDPRDEKHPREHEDKERGEHREPPPQKRK